jgi:gliding motility-associated lipoprotein GldH
MMTLPVLTTKARSPEKKGVSLVNAGKTKPKTLKNVAVLRYLAFLFFITATLLSCTSPPAYEAYQEVGTKGWHQDSAAVFQVKIQDTARPYVVTFHLRTNQAYPYSNLYLFRSISSQERTEYSDTANVKLADKYGRWLGEGMGDLRTFHRPFRGQPLRFSQPGSYTFRFKHAMRRPYLPGVKAVGLTLKQYDGGKAKEE